jgi:hypothetical protein
MRRKLSLPNFVTVRMLKSGMRRVAHRREVHIKIRLEILKERVYLEYIRVDVRIVLKWILEMD